MTFDEAFAKFTTMTRPDGKTCIYCSAALRAFVIKLATSGTKCGQLVEVSGDEIEEEAARLKAEFGESSYPSCQEVRQNAHTGDGPLGERLQTKSPH